MRPVQILAAYAFLNYKCLFKPLCNLSAMSEKQRFTISLPEHVANELSKRSKDIGSNPTEYAADIVKWWYGQGSPPLSEEEKRRRAESSSTRRAS